MKKIIELWIKKAENDIKCAKLILDSEEKLTDMICFHAQQAVEKALKAFLTANVVRVGKTHDIMALIKQSIEVDQDFRELPLNDLAQLTFYAVEVRYPDDYYLPTLSEARRAVELAEMVLERVKNKLKLQGE